MPLSSAERVERRRAALRAQGLRPVQIWVPDTRAPGFDEEARRQSRIVAEAEAQDPDIPFWEQLADDAWEEDPKTE